MIDGAQEGKCKRPNSSQERSMQAGYSRWSIDDRPIFSAEFQADKRGLVTSFLAIHII